MQLAAWAAGAAVAVAWMLGNPGKPPPTSPTARIHVSKSRHRLEVVERGALVRAFGVALGPGGPGVKRREGDQITPVGRYHVVSRSPSTFHLFLRLDYPNADDRARFKRLQDSGDVSRSARIGGDIGIHGAPPQPARKATHKDVDWTLGCIALDDAEIDELATLVSDGAIVDIED
jgi:murein L,D-transpeptidase YafK